MRKGDRIHGFDALHRWRFGMNRHIIDKNGRAAFCTCMPAIRTSGKPMLMRVHHNSKKYHLEQWYREYVFERNLERAERRRVL